MILVTGAGGMVGSHMVQVLHEKGCHVIGTYYKPTVNINEIDSRIPMIECDVRYPQNIEQIIFQYRPDQIYHLAAQSFPTVSWEHPYETIEINIGGTIAVFEAVKKLRHFQPGYDPVVVVACSSAEYGAVLNETGNCKVKENACLMPLHPYGVSKVGQDLLAFQYYQNDNIKTIRARIFNTTGMRKVNDVTSDFTKRAIEQIKIGTDNPILRVGNIETSRAIMDVNDLIKALLMLADKGHYGEVYNISSEHIYKIKDIITIIEQQLGVKFRLQVDETLIRPTDEKIIVGDISKLKRDTGWKQSVSLEVTIARMLDYWKTRK